MQRPPKRKRTLPLRSEQIKSLQSGDEFDVLIIGGGATGAGCALDSVTRGMEQTNTLQIIFFFAILGIFTTFHASFPIGLKTALVELDDFASGTSSRSTKLIHGGVRYLQKAILGVSTTGNTLSSPSTLEVDVMLVASLVYRYSLILSSIEWLRRRCRSVPQCSNQRPI